MPQLQNTVLAFPQVSRRLLPRTICHLQQRAVICYKKLHLFATDDGRPWPCHLLPKLAKVAVSFITKSAAPGFTTMDMSTAQSGRCAAGSVVCRLPSIRLSPATQMCCLPLVTLSLAYILLFLFFLSLGFQGSRALLSSENELRHSRRLSRGEGGKFL